MKILMSQKETINEHGDAIDVLERNYIYYFSDKFVIIPVPNNLKVAKKIFDLADGVILTGGGDFDEQPNRNLVENELIKLSIKKDIPLIGICRGMQFINKYFGGKLSTVDNHVRVTHKIKFTTPQNDEGQKKVNSYHRYGIKKNDVANDLIIDSFSDNDEVVESFHHKKYKIRGIQWHPERDNGLSKWIDKKIFRLFEE
jgi:putative glutamine amidotransferase